MQIHAIVALEEARISTIAANAHKNTKNCKKNLMFILIIKNNAKKHTLKNKNRY
jgi:hypothetical protein